MAWAAFHAVEVVSSSRFAHKRIGYHVIAQSFSDQTPVLLLITNQLRKDLNSSNEYEKSQDDDDDFVPMPMVLKDQDADPEATIVQISFGDRLRVLIDTVTL
ncbi:AP-3 complex subunit delta [Brassica napus]|uniref:AP-3 complex subunit delta n=1 Tax=Brassica napus TaxID=3708 RepID=UPI0020790256|nr:AP-3 complex subunit delta [Brassica napus]XP_048603350.1 AP-3 complex subunit delta [Brassica napus]